MTPNERKRKWYHDHRDTELVNRKARRAAGLDSSKSCRRRLRLRVLKILGDKCIRCGFSDERALQVDHVDGGGHEELKKSTYGVLLSVLRDSTPYQLLCANCNWIKRVDNNE